jgi:cardiolipin synthase
MADTAPTVNGRSGRLVRERITRSRPITLAEADGRPVAVKLRDGAARLLSPYL